MYNSNNIFAKVLRNEVAVKKILENEFALAFYDAYPKKKIHALVIPKILCKDFLDFMIKAQNLEITGFFKAVKEVVNNLELKLGYRLISNSGEHGCQEVEHFHMHILGGENVGDIVSS